MRRKPSLAKILGGKRAQSNGVMFEEALTRNARFSQIACTRMPDGCKQLNARRIIRVKTPFDFILTKNGKSAFIDTKTLDDKSFANSKIEEHQVNGIMPHVKAGSLGGYVVFARAIDTIYFIPVSVLHYNLYSPTRGSIGPIDPGCVILGSFANWTIDRMFP